MLRILSFFHKQTLAFPHIKKGMTENSVIPNMRLKHRLTWNKLPSGRAYSMIAKVGIFFLKINFLRINF
jgi:hypothetical protein